MEIRRPNFVSSIRATSVLLVRGLKPIPVKLSRQIARFGASIKGMPPLIVYEGADGILVIYNGVTRATRIAKLAPGTLIPVEVIGRLRRSYQSDPSIGELLK